MVKRNREVSSFRDPAGYIYYENDKVYRRINKCYFKEYNHLMNSGLYDELVSNGYLVKHTERTRNDDYIDIEVEKIDFVSYPYEWCFLEYKEAGILTLKIMEICLKYGMILKDSSSYNVQFKDGGVIFIDTLSFMFYEDGDAWGGYGQFCRHFMGPLLLMSKVNEKLNNLMRCYIDGIPVDVCLDILKNRGGFIAREHIRWQVSAIRKSNNSVEVKKVKMSKKNIINMVMMMERQISSLKRRVRVSEWGDYYGNTNYDGVADKDKIDIVCEYLDKINFKEGDLIFDMGSNDGKYSRVAKRYGKVISWDIDENAVNNNYLMMKESNEEDILPLILDFNNPSPNIGFGLKERKSINERGNVRCVMALALIHHMAISNNVMFSDIALWFRELGEYLIIEFVLKDDTQVEKLLRTRRDIFDNYNLKFFEEEFGKYFLVLDKRRIKNSKRVLYLMKRS